MKKMLMREYVGRQVRSRYSLGNSLGHLPAGTIFTVDSTTVGKLHLTSEPCPKCGLRVYIRKVSKLDVELIEEGSDD